MLILKTEVSHEYADEFTADQRGHAETRQV